jgi:hypothetical protein
LIEAEHFEECRLDLGKFLSECLFKPLHARNPE